MLEVLVVAKAFPPNLGGVETASEQIAAAYARAGANVRVITQFSGPLGLQKRSAHSAEFDVINVGPGSQFVIFLRMLRAVRRVLKVDAIDITHATTWRVQWPVLVACVLGRNAGKRIVMIHGREVLQTRGILSLAMRIAVGLSDRALIISKFSRAVCQERLPSLKMNGTVSWNGLTWPEAPPKSNYQTASDGFVKLFTACQLTPRKNIAAAVEAVAILASRYGIDANLAIAGTGVEQSKLESLCCSLGVVDRVHFLGVVKRHDLPSLYQSADIFVHPHSHSHDKTDIESFCLSIADAMSLGLPVISGQDGAPPEYITNGINGLLVDGKSAEAIAEKVSCLIRMGEAGRHKMGAAAAEFAKRHFSWDQHIIPALELMAAVGQSDNDYYG